MKRITLLAIALLYVGVNFSNAQLFPKVDKPTSDNTSMLVLQFACEKDDGSGYEIVTNNNFTGWAPVVKGPNGDIVPFRKFDSAADINNIFYSENLEAGEYTLIGFYHVYADYGKLDEYRKEINNPNYLMSYEPYANKPFHIKQLVELDEPVIAKLEAGTIMPLGNFAVKYKWVAGLMGETDDRWKVRDDVKIVFAEPFNEYVARYIKVWATPKWKKWNARNPYEKL